MLKPTFQISNRLFSYLTGLSFCEKVKMFRFSNKIPQYTISSLHYSLLPSDAYPIAFMRTVAGEPHSKLQRPGRFAFVIPASPAAPVAGFPRESAGTGLLLHSEGNVIRSVTGYVTLPAIKTDDSVFRFRPSALL